MKKLTALALSLIMILTCLPVLAEGVLVMATNPEFPPFEYMEGDQVVGLDVDIATEIAKDLGLTLQVESMAFDSIITAIQTGKADVGIAGISVTPERMLSVDFSDSYFDASQVCIVKADSGINSLEDLTDKLIGVQLGTTGDLIASDITKDVERYQKGVDAVLELKGGKIDAVILDKPVAMNILKALNDAALVMKNEIEFEPETYAIAIAKNKTELLEGINKAIARIYEDGTMDALIEKYFEE